MGTFALNSGHGGTLRPVSLGVALLVLSGCKTLPTGPGETLASVSRQTAEAVAQQAAPRPSALASPPAAGPSGAGQGQGARPLSISPGELSTLQALFAKSTVTGKDLFFQLEKIRNIVLVGGSVASLMSPGTSDQAASAAFDPRAEVLRAAMATTEEVLAPYLSSIGVGAFGLHIASLTEDSGVMAKQTIKLPSGQGMSPAQMQRVVNMAAMILASRATSKMLQSAIADFASVEADYRKLIERRESTAKVLYDVVTRAGSGSGGVAGLTSEDLRYLNETVRRMSVQQFSNDLGAQNLALAYLRATNQAAWSEYKVRSDSVRASTRGYIRTVAGVGAFAALLATFGNETLGAVQKQRAAELLGAFPFPGSSSRKCRRC